MITGKSSYTAQIFEMSSIQFLYASLIAWLLCASGTRDSFAQELFKSAEFTKENSFTGGVEGPAVDRDGNLYAVNFKQKGTIGRVSPDGDAGIFIVLPDSSVGNGIRFDSHGNMFIADYMGHNILKVDMISREVSVFAHESRMTQPNDLAIDGRNRIYASDPDFRAKKGRIWRIDTDGSVTLLDSLRGATNGIEVSPNDKTLYVNAVPKVWAYDLSNSGEIKNKRLLIEFPDHLMDGMRCDSKGNLYITRYGKGTVVKVSPKGKIIREVPLIGKKPSNLAFGGKDGRTVYVTIADRGNIEYFLTDFPGREWKMQKRSGKK
jgi:sugar lactone lactonase YvrE